MKAHNSICILVTIEKVDLTSINRKQIAFDTTLIKLAFNI